VYSSGSNEQSLLLQTFGRRRQPKGTAGSQLAIPIFCLPGCAAMFLPSDGKYLLLKLLGPQQNSKERMRAQGAYIQ
jgi:hypothetical protein